jgi:hypothetical protein
MGSWYRKELRNFMVDESYFGDDATFNLGNSRSKLSTVAHSNIAWHI